MKRTIGVWTLLMVLSSACGDEPATPPATTPPPGGSGGTDMMGLPPGPTPDTPKAPTTTPLPRSTPEAEGISSQGVLSLVEGLEAQIDEVHSLMLVRHGKVVAEGWWAPYTPGDMHNMYSVTKSFNSTAVGMAVAEGLLSVDDLAISFFPEHAAAAPAAFQQMTVKHLLTMSTGHAQDTIDRMRMTPGGQWTKGFFELNVENAPGSSFLYNSGAAYVLGAIVQKLTGQTVDEYLTPRLFEPLGISNRLWGVSPEGVNMTDGGLAITTEELAKFGQLYLQKGQWNGEQLITEQWATDATSKQVVTGADNGNWNFGYGYQFWRSTVGFRADGSLGQYSFVLPDEDLVLAVTAATSNDGGTNRLMNVVFQHLLDGMVQTDPLPEDGAAHDALTAKLTSVALAIPEGADSSPLAADISGSRYAIAPNSQGITAIQLTFSDTGPVLTIEDADGPHPVAVGIGQWLRGRTGFKKHINELFDTPDQAISARGAWIDDSTFDVKLAFTETPYTMNAVFVFAQDQVTVNMTYNVRWGSATEPTITGTR
jgi:CubicO group peptidase (beta-lactamase class C family)